MSMMSGVRGQREEFVPKPNGVEYPLAASCLGCRKDETAAPGVKLSRCARCKLVRYVCFVLLVFLWMASSMILLHLGIVARNARLRIGRDTSRFGLLRLFLMRRGDLSDFQVCKHVRSVKWENWD
jgi:hypothetical protein